jgi:hypothetical protein
MDGEQGTGNQEHGKAMGQSRIRIVPESEATGDTARIYQEMRAYFGIPTVPDIFKLVSLRPDFLRVLMDGYLAMFDGGMLPDRVKQMIAAIVSKTNSCSY